MRLMTIFGTRPELIRLSLILSQLDRYCEHITVHTGQNFQASLSDVFISELGIRTPDVHLGIKASSFADQAAQILIGVDRELEMHRPDKVLILGDTNSALSAIACARRGIPVFHLEAGNRCYDNRVPEEVNRRIIDHSSDVLMPYTERSKENLLAEGIDRDRIYVVGNPIYEVLKTFETQIDERAILSDLGVSNGSYFLVTLHRAENVDDPARLSKFIEGLKLVSDKFEKDVLVSVHPRTADKLSRFGIGVDGTNIRLQEPFGFLDFVKLEKNSFGVLTDSGTVQEECAIFGVPNVTLRDVTERPETIECGSNIIAGAEPESILRSVTLAVEQASFWQPPSEYLTPNCSQIVSKVVLGYTSLRRHH